VKKLALATAFASWLAGVAVGQGAAIAAGDAAQQPAPDPAAALPAGLSDLEKTTFACPKAALNAAAREVGKYPSLGTYQFSYFNIISDSHHAAYEVRFTSNYAAEPVLKFCVSLYCQQGFDPATTTSVALIGAKAAAHAAGGGHAVNACSPPRMSAPRRTRR
jgi:hypothetical protein